MSIVYTGPSIPPTDWKVLEAVIAYLLAVKEDDSQGASVQKAVDKRTGMDDQVAGKTGPKIGVWDPEKTNRLIQEF